MGGPATTKQTEKGPAALSVLLCRVWRVHFEDLLNPTSIPSVMEAETGDEGDDLPVTGGEVTNVVKNCLVADTLGWGRWFSLSPLRLWVLWLYFG